MMGTPLPAPVQKTTLRGDRQHLLLTWTRTRRNTELIRWNSPISFCNIVIDGLPPVVPVHALDDTVRVREVRMPSTAG